MKFLLITKPLEMPIPDNFVELVKAAKEWINDKIADGTFDFVYALIPSGGVGIANADSHEKLMDTIAAHPFSQFLEWKIKPLMDIHHLFDKTIESLGNQ